jgi:N6-L-threonylcarbamoyladenine synthase
MLVLVSSPDEFKTAATTADTSLGRVYDHVAKLLGIAPGELGLGAALEAFCERNVPDSVLDAERTPAMPLAMRGQLAFSYAGLHSTVERFVREQGGPDRMDSVTRLKVARDFQAAAVAHLEEKVVLALEACWEQGVDVRDIVVSGGVASNMYLRRRCVQRSFDRSTVFSSPAG